MPNMYTRQHNGFLELELVKSLYILFTSNTLIIFILSCRGTGKKIDCKWINIIINYPHIYFGHRIALLDAYKVIEVVIHCVIFIF